MSYQNTHLSLNDTMYIRYSQNFGMVVNSNAGPNTFYQKMLEDFIDNKNPKRELILHVNGNEVVFIPKPTKNKTRSVNKNSSV